MKKFQFGLIIRVLILTATIFLLAYIYFNSHLAATELILSALIIIQIFLLIRYVNTTNYELTKFFNSVKHSDFSRIIMPKELGSSFKELNKALSNVINQFRATRSETEEHFQYLQTIVKQVGTGLISFNDKGEISLLNESAKRILNISEIKNLHTLANVNPEFVNILNNIKAGEQELFKLSSNGKEMNLSIYASEFKLRGDMYKLVSLQDIRNELERERLGRELEIARQLQLRLLPEKNPSVEGYTIQGFCLPAKEVGGDYYDFIELADNKLGIVIGDVAGKGLPAAIYMTLTKGIFLSFTKTNISPKEALIKVNHLLYQSLRRGSFVTMCFAILDNQKNELTIARAGHEPLLYTSDDDSAIKEIKPKGLGLGLEEGKIFESDIEEQTIKLNEKDLVIFYTDGVSDSRDSSLNNYGIKRIKDFITKNKDLPITQLVTETVLDVRNFSGSTPQYDDMTLIAVKRQQ
jgi:serine phosphatase RsbU (regulator of sigma subunit)/PAS domain-containing protein